MCPEDKKAQVTAMLGADPAPFETLVSHLMSSSNEQRSLAEDIFKLCKQTDANSSFLKLGQLLQLSPHMVKSAPPQHTDRLSCFRRTIESLVIRRHRRILETPVDLFVTPAVRSGKAKICSHRQPKAKNIILLRGKAKIPILHCRKVKTLVLSRCKAQINHRLDSELGYITLRLFHEKKLVDDYLPSQPELNAKSRRNVLHSAFDLHTFLKLSDQSLYLIVSIVDRFLSSAPPILRGEFHLLGMTAMHIATKYEECTDTGHLEVEDFIDFYDERGYTCEEMLAMQDRILYQLDWNLEVPTVYTFLPHFIQVADNPLEGTTMANLTYYYAELGVLQYEIATSYCPSMLAASAVYAARASLRKHCVWPKKLEIHTGYKELQLLECAQRMVDVYLKVKEHKHSMAVRQKYARLRRDAVAELDVSIECVTTRWEKLGSVYKRRS